LIFAAHYHVFYKKAFAKS